MGNYGAITPGTYTLTIGPDITDPAGNAMDQDGDGTPGESPGDVFTGTFTISLPDLTFDTGDPNAVVAPATAEFGETIAVSWKGKNAGTFQAVGPWQDGVYLSADQEWNAADTLLRLQSVSGSVAPDADYAVNASVTLPLDASSQAGTYYLLLKSNAEEILVEADLTNNVLAEEILLELPALPDLTASDISAPTTGNPGQSVPISWKETNVAAASMTTGPWRTRVYLSADELAGDDVLVASFDYSGTLAPGSPVTGVALLGDGRGRAVWHCLLVGSA